MEVMERLETIPALYRWLSVFGLIGLLAVGYWYFQHQPHMEQMAELQGQIIAKQVELAKYEKIASQKEAFKAEVAVLEAELLTLLKLLPKGKEIPDLIRQISDLGVRTGLQIDLIRPQPEQVKEFYAEVPIIVRVKGRYHSAGRFFDALARLPRIISVSGVQIESKANVQETECLATTYRFLDEEEVNEATRAKKATTKTPDKAKAEPAETGVGKKK